MTLPCLRRSAVGRKRRARVGEVMNALRTNLSDVFGSAMTSGSSRLDSARATNAPMAVRFGHRAPRARLAPGRAAHRELQPDSGRAASRTVDRQHTAQRLGAIAEPAQPAFERRSAATVVTDLDHDAGRSGGDVDLGGRGPPPLASAGGGLTATL